MKASEVEHLCDEAHATPADRAVMTEECERYGCFQDWSREGQATYVRLRNQIGLDRL